MTREKAESIISALVKLRDSVTDEQAASFIDIYPEWRAGVAYVSGQRVVYKDILYKILQDHTSQEYWFPDKCPSLFSRILIPDANVVPEWVQPDSTNPYMKGDKVKHNGFEWTSLIDNNVWEPTDAVPTLWQKITG